MEIFKKKTYQQDYSELLDNLKLKTAQENDDYIISHPIEDLVKYYLGQRVQPLELDDSIGEAISHHKSIKTVYSHERERGYQHDDDLKVEIETIIVKLPIVLNNKVQQI